MDPFTVVLIVAGVLVVGYAGWSFVRPRVGHHISQDAPSRSEAVNTSRIIHDTNIHHHGGGPGGSGGNSGF